MIVENLVKKFPILYGTQNVLYVFTRYRHWLRVLKCLLSYFCCKTYVLKKCNFSQKYRYEHDSFHVHVKVKLILSSLFRGQKRVLPFLRVKRNLKSDIHRPFRPVIINIWIGTQDWVPENIPMDRKYFIKIIFLFQTKLN